LEIKLPGDQATWRSRCQSIMPISLDHTAASLERSGWIAPTTTPPSNPRVVSSTGTTSSFGSWIDLSSGSMPRQSRCSKSQWRRRAKRHGEASGRRDRGPNGPCKTEVGGERHLLHTGACDHFRSPAQAGLWIAWSRSLSSVSVIGRATAGAHAEGPGREPVVSGGQSKPGATHCIAARDREALDERRKLG
jgi:hypothetical protein